MNGLWDYSLLKKATLSAVMELTRFECSLAGGDQLLILSSCDPSSSVILWVDEIDSEEAVHAPSALALSSELLRPHREQPPMPVPLVHLLRSQYRALRACSEVQ